MTGRASIIISTFDRCTDLCECLDSLPPSLLAEHGAEVLVVDDGSTDRTSETLAARYPHVDALRNDSNRGPSFSRNRASRRARGDLLLFLDSDVIVGEDWLPEMTRAYDGGTILIGRVVDHLGGRTQSGPRRATFMGRSLRCSPERANTGASCNLGVPRAVFQRIGGFDEELPYYFEDSDLCIRARKAGCSFRYVTEAIVRHKGTEFKKGSAIHKQEHNCTYAMLKAYRGRPLLLLAFTGATATWAGVRVVARSLRGRFREAGHIIGGTASAYRRFLRGRGFRGE